MSALILLLQFSYTAFDTAITLLLHLLINQPKKRVALPKSVRDSVWNHYIGEDINKHRCLCCKKVLINNRQFDVGHVISVNDGGTHEINNLRPICFPCNHSMGTTNMIEFVKTYGYYIG